MEQTIEVKAEQLSKALNCTVKPLVFVDAETKEEVVGFVKEPDRLLKLRMLDKSQQDGAFSFAAQVYDSILLKEESDPRLSSLDSKYDRYYLGGVMEAYKMVEISINNFKKK